MLKNYKELNVWQKAYHLCLEIYKITRNFPKEEKYGLTSQIRRAAVSIPSNIAYGSLCELETQILLGGDLGYIKPEKMNVIHQAIGDTERMLKGLIKSLENKHYITRGPSNP